MSRKLSLVIVCLLLALTVVAVPLVAFAAGANSETAVNFVVPEGVGTVESMTPDSSGNITLPDAPVDSREGYTFEGWATEALNDATELPTIYEVGASYNISSGTTLYAVYSYVVGNDA